MKKRKYHVIRYIDTQEYYVVYVFNLDDYANKAKLIRVFDDFDKAVAFKAAMELL